jgi:hypothetical protein
VSSHPEVIPVVIQEFFEAGTGYIGELQLGFLGGASGFTSLEEVLFAGTGGLDHLVDSSVPFAEVFVCEVEGEVIDYLGFLKGKQGLVVSSWRD